MTKENRSVSSLSLHSVLSLKRRRPSAPSPPSSGSMRPISAISANRSTTLCTTCASCTGPRVSSSRRRPGAAAGAAAAAGPALALAVFGPLAALAGLLALAAGAFRAGACSAWADCTAPASSRTRASSSVVSGGPPPAPWCSASCAFSASPACRSTSTIGADGASSWRRSLSSSVSIWCVSSATSAKPKVAAPPLTECAQRKIAFSSSSLADSMSMSSSSCSIRSRFSPASSKKTWWNCDRSMPAALLALVCSLIASPFSGRPCRSPRSAWRDRKA